MAELVFHGTNASYSYGGMIFQRGEPRDAGEHEEYLLSTGLFSHARVTEPKVAPKKRGGVVFKDAPAKDAVPDFPANGFRTKRDLQTYAREHLGYEADLNKALKTLNEEARGKYTEKYAKPAAEAAEERPDDLFDDDDELDTAAGLVPQTPAPADAEAGETPADDDIDD